MLNPKPLSPPFSYVLLICRLEDWEKIDSSQRKATKPVFAMKINEGDKEVISMIAMGGYKDNIRRSKLPHNYRTSIVLTDEHGNTIFDEWGNPEKRSIAINEEVWLEYRRHNRDLKTNRTDCSAIREFIRLDPNCRNEDICLFVEMLISGQIKEWHQLTLMEQQKILRFGRSIVLFPVKRKEPSKTPIK